MGGLHARRGQQQGVDDGAMRGGGRWQAPLGGEGGAVGGGSRVAGGSTGSSWGPESDVLAPLVSVLHRLVLPFNPSFNPPVFSWCAHASKARMNQEKMTHRTVPQPQMTRMPQYPTSRVRVSGGQQVSGGGSGHARSEVESGDDEGRIVVNPLLAKLLGGSDDGDEFGDKGGGRGGGGGGGVESGGGEGEGKIKVNAAMAHLLLDDDD
jgi:hypothetical protein